MHLVLIGASGFGRYHLQAWRKHPDVQRLTVVGRSPARLAALADEFGVGTTTDPAVVAEADLVDICTPPDTHAELAAQAMAAGRATIIEKPPCRTADQATALRGQFPTASLQCVMNQRFSPLWLRVRQLIADGAVGRPKLSLWPALTNQLALMTGDDFRADAARGGGALLDGAFHLAYLVPWVLGTPITAASGWAGQLAVSPPAGEDTGLMVWEMAGQVAQLTYSWAVADAPRSPAATIFGDEATLVVPRSAKQPIERLAQREAVELDLGEYRTMSRNDLANCLGHYAAVAWHHAEPQASWSVAVSAQRVIEATLAAAAAGRRVELP